MSSKTYQRDLPVLLGAIVGIVIILNFFLSPNQALTSAKTELLNWTTIAAAFGLLVGAVGTLLLHISRASKGESIRVRGMSVLTLATMVVFIIVGLSFRGYTTSSEYIMLYSNIAAGLLRSTRAVAFFSCLIGAWAAFRADSVDSFMMFIGGTIYLIRSIAAGEVLMPWIVPAGEWLSMVINVGATRGGIIAAAVGALVLAIRVFTGKEKSVEELILEV